MRYRLTAVIAAICLTLSFTTAAGSSTHPRPHYNGIHLGMLQSQAATDRMLNQAGLHDLGTRYAILGKAPKTRRRNQVIDNIAEGVISGQIVLIIQYLGKHPEVIKMFKEWVFRKVGSKFVVYRNAGDHQCMGDWGLDTINHLGSCKSHHGIYWNYYGTGAFWNTYTGGALISRSDSDGSPIFTNRTKIDWYTWGYQNVDSSACGSNGFCGVVFVLYNHQSTGISDTQS